MKIVRLTYGVHDDGREKQEYAYLASDNVKVGDIVQPTVNHAKSGKLFATTGIIQATNKTTSKGGKQEIEKLRQVEYTHEVAPEMQAIVKEVDGKRMLVGLKRLGTGVATLAIDARIPNAKEEKTFTYAQSRTRTQSGTFEKDDYIGKATKGEGGRYELSSDTPYNTQNAYVQRQRQYNVSQAKKESGAEKFDNLGD